MKKISFLSLFFVAMAATVVWAQDEAPKQSRSLSVYIDASSGHLAPGHLTSQNKANIIGENRAFDGSEMEVGLRYSQNFKSAPKVSMGGTLKFVNNYPNTYDVDGNWIGSQAGGQTLFRANVWVAVPNFMVLIDTRGLMGLYLYHSFGFGKAGSFSLGFDAEFFYTGNPWYGNADENGNFRPVFNANGQASVNGVPVGNPVYVLDYAGFWLGYSISLGKGFAYGTGLQFRLGGNGRFGGVEFDAAAGFHIRWNNTFSYSVDGWNFYLQFRLEGFNLITPTSTVLKALNRDASAKFQIVSGLSYSFDLSK